MHAVHVARNPGRWLQRLDGNHHVRSRCAAREVPRGARQARARHRQRAVHRGRRRVRALRATIRTSTPIDREPLTDEVEVGDRRRRLQRPARGARLREAGLDRHPHGREGRRLRRHLVLEPLSRGVQCDIESYIYLPLLEELGYMPKEKYSYGRRDPGDHSQRIGHHFDLYRDACFQTQVDRPDLGRRVARWTVRHRPRRRDDRPLRRDGDRGAAPAEAAGHPWRRVLRGPHLPHEPVGLRLHRRRHRRRPRPARRQAGRHHRHRGDGGPVHPPSRRGRGAPVRLPAHPVVGRRPRQPADRPRVGGILEPGWQQRRIDNFSILVSGASRGRGPGRATGGPTSSATC